MQPHKQTFFSSLLTFVNRPMLALSVLIHIGLLSLPLPDAAPTAEERPEDVSMLDLAQVSLAQSPLVEDLPVQETPLALPSLTPSPSAKPTADPSRAPRPPKKVTPTPFSVSTPTPTPTPAPTPAPPTPTPKPEETTLTVPSAPPSSPQTSVSPPIPTPNPSPTPAEPPPPPEEDLPEGSVTMTREEMRDLFARLRDNLPESESQEVYPSRLAQPELFFKGTVVNEETATTSACLEIMVSCWWQPRKPQSQLLIELKQHPLLANLKFDEIPEGYGGGKLYHLEPTDFYLTLTKPSGISSDTMVSIWGQNPRDFLDLMQ